MQTVGSTLYPLTLPITEIQSPMSSPVINTVDLGVHWPTIDPFLFCAHHCDNYPAGNLRMGVESSELQGRNMGSDFTLRDGWRMYHGREVPGFPQHPHRGFETITIAKSGYIDHSDSLGAQARFGRGDVQWMTAGQGIVHSEMFPLIRTDDRNPAELFQIWLNLPAKSKMVPPYFTMIWSEHIQKVRHVDDSGALTEISVIAGQLGDARGAATPPDSWAADPAHGVNVWTIRMEPGAQWTLPAADAEKARVLYAHDTQGLTIADRALTRPSGVQLEPTKAVALKNGEHTTELLLLEATPIGEPVAQHGPFVMNTRDELVDAFRDYQTTKFGGWPWPADDPVLARETGRFARHSDGRVEEPETRQVPPRIPG